MQHDFDLYDLQEDSKELRTPLDNRTAERKRLISRVREIKGNYATCEYGIWGYLRVRDMHTFIKAGTTATN